MASSDGAARILRSALPPGPGAASPGEAYSGSRKSAQRFEYSVHSTAGFVELAPSSFRAVSWNDRFVAAKEFYNALAKVPGVAEVPWGGLPIIGCWLHKGQVLPARCARSQALPARFSFGVFE